MNGFLIIFYLQKSFINEAKPRRFVILYPDYKTYFLYIVINLHFLKQGIDLK